MKICYHGHACFSIITRSGTRLVTDPYGGIGYPPLSLFADAVTVSHGHYDHCELSAVKGAKVLSEAGTYTVGDVKIEAVESFHDDCRGAKRGKNLIFRFTADGITLCHLGDLGEAFTEARVKTICPADVLLIPVGGVYTIDAALAKRYADAVAPKVVVPMHYQTPKLQMHLAGVGEFTRLFSPQEVERCGAEVDFGEELPSCRKIFVMEYRQ